LGTVLHVNEYNNYITGQVVDFKATCLLSESCNYVYSELLISSNIVGGVAEMDQRSYFDQPRGGVVYNIGRVCMSVR